MSDPAEAEKPRRRYQTDSAPPTRLKGPWSDIGEGECQRCGTRRRLYRPHAAPELAFCAKCAVSRHNRSFENSEYDPAQDQDDYDNDGNNSSK